MTRKELINIIKRDNLGEEVKKNFGGRNYTNLSTDALNAWYEARKVSKETIEQPKVQPTEVKNTNIPDYFVRFISVLQSNRTISAEQAAFILK